MFPACPRKPSFPEKGIEFIKKLRKRETGCKFDPFKTTPFNREVTQAATRNAVAQIRAIREAAGPDFDIAIDVHSRWNINSTLQIIRALERCRLFFYEEGPVVRVRNGPVFAD